MAEYGSIQYMGNHERSSFGKFTVRSRTMVAWKHKIRFSNIDRICSYQSTESHRLNFDCGRLGECRLVQLQLKSFTNIINRLPQRAILMHFLLDTWRKPQIILLLVCRSYCSILAAILCRKEITHYFYFGPLNYYGCLHAPPDRQRKNTLKHLCHSTIVLCECFVFESSRYRWTDCVRWHFCYAYFEKLFGMAAIPGKCTDPEEKHHIQRSLQKYRFNLQLTTKMTHATHTNTNSYIEDIPCHYKYLAFP